MKIHLVALVLIISTILIFTNSFAQADDTVPNPIKQIKSGVLPQDVQCKEGFVLVIWPFDQSPACLSPEKSTRLLAHGWITPANLPLAHLRAPTGYLGGYFTSSRTEFILKMYGFKSDFTAPLVPQTATNGHFSFLFSKSNYPQSALSVSYQSCARSFITEGGPRAATNANGTAADLGHVASRMHQSCTPAQPLSFTYGENSQGKYAVTTKDVVLPCGNVAMMGGQLLPTKYDFVTFSVKTGPNSSPFAYNYLIYSQC